MFSGVRIRVGFQPKPQLTFCCMAVHVKPGFVAMSLSTTPPKGLLPKVKFAATPMHYHNRSVNPSGPKCPIESTTHRFPRLDVKAS
jgi:hypothetical protein